MLVEGMPTILSVDPAKVSGWAVFRPTTEGKYSLVRYGTARTDARTSFALLRWCISGQDPSSVVLVIEEQYLPRIGEKGASPGSAFKLARSRHQWQVVAELVSVPVQALAPQKWQSAVLGVNRGVHRSSRKRLARKVATNAFGGRFSSDEADAVCMALYEAQLRLQPVDTRGAPARGERL